METVRRKTLLYRSNLGFWCINHVLGCSHGCSYPCYAFLMAKRYGRVKGAAEWRRPRLVEDALGLLRRELKRKRSLPDSVHLCLTTDPFMVGQPEVGALSLALIEHLNATGIPASVLTKGLLPVELAETPRFRRDNTLGVSLISLDERFRRRFEPGAAPYRERVAALRRLHQRGCRTRVHIEPYPTPDLVEQEVLPLLEAVGFVDELYFGGWNYSALARRYPDRERFYREQGRLVRGFCREHGISATVDL